MPSRLWVRLSAVAAIAAVPLSVASVHAVGTTSPIGSTAGPTLGLTAASVAAGLGPQPVAAQVTLVGRLQLRTAAERRAKISLASAKGRHTWTASALAEHDVPSAAMRAYRTAATRIDATEPGCHLPWTLLAGIGRVESDHGRYGGSVLGADGLSRPAIVGVALNGVGAVAAIHDSDGGRFDGDRVWDRAVGPMQFIPTTWRSAGMDGDGDGVASPNDIDDASLAAASYLCPGGRDLSDPSQVRAAIFSYNPSDYYVDLVSAFATGYQTGSFVIPSPAVAPGSGDGVVAVRDVADQSATARAADRAAKRAHARAAARARAAAHRRAEARQAAAEARAEQAKRHPTPKPKPDKPKSTPTPTPTPTPGATSGPRSGPRPGQHPTPAPASTPPSAASTPPSAASTPTPTSGPIPAPSPVPMTALGPVVAGNTGWSIGTVPLTPADLVSLPATDLDRDGVVEPAAQEMAGLVASGVAVTLTYLAGPPLVVVSLTVG